MRKQTQQQVIKRTIYAQQELDTVFQEVGGHLGKDARIQWLLKHKAIRLRDNDIVVIQASDDSFPYTSLCDKWDALVYRENKKEFAQAKTLEQYDEMAQQRDSLFSKSMI